MPHRRYRILDRKLNKLLLSTDDYASVLIFVNRHMQFDARRHVIIKNGRHMSLEQVYAIKNKLGAKARDLKLNLPKPITKPKQTLKREDMDWLDDDEETNPTQEDLDDLMSRT